VGDVETVVDDRRDADVPETEVAGLGPEPGLRGRERQRPVGVDGRHPRRQTPPGDLMETGLGVVVALVGVVVLVVELVP
jgi:hypothetical protein